ncbi:lysine 2,3-aminomutase [Candidatus Pacearchaeota archaeon]|jgi:KamA family protein|nr:lysine 2,3-aminomutase [Candidatus Pacearchaeota archaeon]|tara:strand:- start:22645 stop:23739 length:1095 start_codon:yes stop_codon:yes gene_type:complete
MGEGILINGISSIKQLKRYISIPKKEEIVLEKVVKIHPIEITKYYLSLIDKNDKNDPIKKMIVPSVEEMDLSGDYDTSGESENTKTVGLQHKYPQTALMLLTNRCAAYCRYCFRKRLVGLQTKEILKRVNDATDYIKKHKEIDNVLISGGDSLIQPTEVIEKVIKLLFSIPHIRYIRFGSKIPVVFPDRIIKDKKLLEVFKKYSKNKQIYIITHFNHPKEITKKSTEAVSKFIKSGVIVKNQTVLLKGVNDNPEILSKLMNKLTSIGVNPYYIFQCRPVKRVKNHFQVTLYDGIKIVEEAKKQLSGLGKRFKYMMSHKTGKIEIIGIMGDYMYFKYHQAKNQANVGKLFKKRINKEIGWLDNLK